MPRPIAFPYTTETLGTSVKLYTKVITSFIIGVLLVSKSALIPKVFTKVKSGRPFEFAKITKSLIFSIFLSVNSTPLSSPPKISVATEIPPTLPIAVTTSGQ